MPGHEIKISEELWFGDGAEDTAEQVAAQSLVAMSAKIVGLHPFQHVAQKIIQMTQNPECQMRELAAVIEKDPPFAVRTLRLVHSAAYAIRVRCTSISHAVSLLGIKAIGEMATAWATLDMFASHEPFCLQLKEHAITTGGLTRQLARKLSLPSDDIYTCGLMHDIGKLFLLQDGDESYLQYLERGLAIPDSLHILERQAYGYDHAVLAAHILRAWGIPEPVPLIVAWHHQPERALSIGGEVAQMVSLVRVANLIAYAIRNEASLEQSIPLIIANPCTEYIQLSQEQLQSWWPEFITIAQESQELVAPVKANLQKVRISSVAGLGNQITAECSQCGKLVYLATDAINSDGTEPVLCETCSEKNHPAKSTPNRKMDFLSIVGASIGGLVLLLVILWLLRR